MYCIDGLSNEYVKNNFSMSLSLSIIFNQSVNLGIVPNGMKITKVIPLHKNGIYSDVNNYGPISLLSIVPKILRENNLCQTH